MADSRHRSKPMLRRTSEGHRCVGCRICVHVCPSQAIQVRIKFTNSPLVKIEHFALDLSACLFCGECIRVCPVEAVVWRSGEG